MDALVMCGGRGTRLDAAVEKPLFEIGGRPMIGRVLAALRAGPVDVVRAVVSPHVPETRAYLEERGVRSIEAPGDGYVEDLDYALERVDPPVLTVATDLPLLEADLVAEVLDAHDRGSLTVCVPAALKRLLDVSVDLTMERDGETLAPTGINVVSGVEDETVYVTYDVRLAVNVNRPDDASVAEVLA